MSSCFDLLKLYYIPIIFFSLIPLHDREDTDSDPSEVRDWVSGEERKEIFPSHFVLSFYLLSVIYLYFKTKSYHSQGIL